MTQSAHDSPSIFPHPAEKGHVIMLCVYLFQPKWWFIKSGYSYHSCRYNISCSHCPLYWLCKNLYAKGFNWVTVSRSDESAYRSKLARVIVALIILYVLVQQFEIVVWSVIITLDNESTLNQSGGDWPLSIDQLSFDYLQAIYSWIKLSPLQFKFWHVKGHLTNLKYEQLDRWGQKTFMSD